MRLTKARVQNYRSIRDTGWFDVETAKTILVGPNEAGKTAVLQALQQINPPTGVNTFDALRDFPRSRYNDITTKKVEPSKVTVVEAQFSLGDDDRATLPEAFRDCTYTVGRRLDNSRWHRLDGAPDRVTYADIKKDLARLAAHADARATTTEAPSAGLEKAVSAFVDTTAIEGAPADALSAWLKTILPMVEEGGAEEKRHDKLTSAVDMAAKRVSALAALEKRIPVFVLFNNYFRVRPLLHLEHLAQRIDSNILDDKQYDYGNKCLLSLLGFTARELSNLGKAPEPSVGDTKALQKYRDQLDKRKYQLNAASVRLTGEIRRVWAPDPKRPEADRLRVEADAQYLKVGS